MELSQLMFENHNTSSLITFLPSVLLVKDFVLNESVQHSLDIKVVMSLECQAKLITVQSRDVVKVFCGRPRW